MHRDNLIDLVEMFNAPAYREGLREKLASTDFPVNLQGCIERYVCDQLPPGSCMEALFSNDLYDFINRADQNTLKFTKELVTFMRWEVSTQIRGSREAVAAWIRAGSDFRKIGVTFVH